MFGTRPTPPSGEETTRAVARPTKLLLHFPALFTSSVLSYVTKLPVLLARKIQFIFLGDCVCLRWQTGVLRWTRISEKTLKSRSLVSNDG
jgi:hypothetical protein